MKAKHYPYVGDHPDDPPVVSDCEFCNGLGTVASLDNWRNVRCDHCQPQDPDPEPDSYPD